MANEVLTAQSVSGLALELLVRSLVLPRTCAMVPGNEYSGPNGGTITVRVRQPRSSREQVTPGTTITIDPVEEVGVDVQVHHLYDAVQVTDEDLTLKLEDFGRQITEPQTASVSIGAENQITTAMNALDADDTFDASEVEDAILGARETLGTNDVPLGNRWLAVSPAVATPMLKLDKFSRVDASGSPSALRDAVLGMIYGFNVVESAGLEDGSCLAYHSSGIVWANRAPAIPQGASSAAIVNGNGVSMRQLFGFSAQTLSDFSVVSTFAGCSVVYEDGEDATDLKRVVKLQLSGS